MLNIGTLPGVLHIPSFDKNLISISTMGDAGVRTLFENDTCKMVQGAMVLMMGIRIRNLYKMLGKTDNGSCNKVVNPKTDEILSCVADSTMFWCQ